MRKIGELDLLDIVHRPLVGGLAAQRAGGLEWKGDVLEHRHPRQQLVKLLEHHDPIGAGFDDTLALQSDLALGRRQVAADRLEQGRLAAARRANHDEAIALQHVEADAIGRGDQMSLGLVLHGHAADVEQRASRLGTPRRAAARRHSRFGGLDTRHIRGRFRRKYCGSRHPPHPPTIVYFLAETSVSPT